MRLRFFLGGRDLEMQTIAALIREHSDYPVQDRGLGWGAAASAYRDEIEAALNSGERPVLVELRLDIDLPSERIILVDHHNERAGHDRPTSLHQVFDLLGLEQSLWTRRLELIAANDRGYLPAMQAAGASLEEMREIRRADRAAQGVTDDEDQAAERASKRPLSLLDGRLVLFDLPHGKTAPLVDRLQPQLGGPGVEDVLVRSPEEWNFFGRGDWVAALGEHFSDGWIGGDLPERGFWGKGPPLPELDAILAALAERS